MSSSQQQSDSGHDSMIILIAIAFMTLVIWFFFGSTIKEYYLLARLYWVKFYIAILPNFLVTESFYEIYSALDILTPEEWTPEMRHHLDVAIRPYLLFPLGLVFGGFVFYVFRKNPSNSFKRVLNRNSLLRSEVRIWPWVAPILDKDLVALSIDDGAWAMARPPLEFARHYRLFEKDNRTIDKKKAERLFASQLGDLWNGPKSLKPHARALFACFIAQACRDKESSQNGLKSLTLNMAAGKMDYTFADVLIKKHINNPIVQEVFKKHAYKVTVLRAMLELARKNGVLPPNYFLWLRPIDRSLWYSLNCVGRLTPFSEVAGVHAHHLAEKIANTAIERPYVIKAVDALELAIKEVKF